MATASASDNAIEGPARWSLRLFGGFELSALPGGERVVLPGKRERVLLAYLALSPKGSQQRRKLATLLWGDASDETALDNLRTCVWALRKALGDAEHRAIASEGEDIVLDATAFAVDVLMFRGLAAQSDRAACGPDCHKESVSRPPGSGRCCDLWCVAAGVGTLKTTAIG
jgi:DNA-binding SARP family transcriptional activator